MPTPSTPALSAWTAAIVATLVVWFVFDPEITSLKAALVLAALLAGTGGLTYVVTTWIESRRGGSQ
jgi:hypothetical protein